MCKWSLLYTTEASSKKEPDQQKDEPGGVDLIRWGLRKAFEEPKRPDIATGFQDWEGEHGDAAGAHRREAAPHTVLRSKWKHIQRIRSNIII